MRIKLSIILMFVHLLFVAGGQAQEFIKTEKMWSSDGGATHMLVTDCGTVFFTSYSEGYKDFVLNKYAAETDELEIVDLSIVGGPFELLSINQNPVTGEIVLGYYGGILLSYDCGESWELPPVDAPKSNYINIEFDQEGRMYANSGTGKDPYAYWTIDYIHWNRMCYDGFARVEFDVSPEGTIITISTAGSDVFRIPDRDSCYLAFEPYSLPEDPEAEFDAVHAQGNGNWLLADKWYYVFVSEDDGFTWEGRYVPTWGFDKIERASESYVMAGGQYFETDLPSVFLSRDLFQTMQIYNLNIRATPAEMCMDSTGHIWLMMELWNGEGVELHRTKNSFFQIVSSPAEDRAKSSSLISVFESAIHLQELNEQVTVSIYDVAGRLVRRGRLSGLAPELDCKHLSGPFFVVAEGINSKTVERQTVLFY